MLKSLSVVWMRMLISGTLVRIKKYIFVLDSEQEGEK